MRGVQAVLSGLPLYMLVGIVVVIAIAQVNRVAGGVLGALFWLLVAYVGRQAYAQGGSLGVPGLKFPEPVFYLIAAAFGALQLFTAWAALRRRRGQDARRRLMDGDDDPLER